MTRVNEFGQPIGDDLGRWTPPLIPEHVDRVGQYVRLEPLQRARHSIPLFHTFTFAEDTLWTYLPLGPFGDAADIGQLIDSMNRSAETQPYAVIVENEVHGFLSYLRMQPDVGVIEIGWVTFSPMIQRTRASTEAVTLLLEHAFSSGYRRWSGKVTPSIRHLVMPPNDTASDTREPSPRQRTTRDATETLPGSR